MTSLDISAIEKDFPAFLHKIEAGEEIILEKSGKPIARVVPLEKERRAPGADKGKIWLSDDFSQPLPDDILSAFCKCK